MLEISKHVLDVAENAVRAGATLIEIDIVENTETDILSVAIRDNGAGMTPSDAEKAVDPFFTTKNRSKPVGLGISLIKQAAETCGGRFEIESEPGTGTWVYAVFQHSHIDRQPLGDMPGVIAAVIAAAPDIDIIYTHRKNSASVTWRSQDLRNEIPGLALNHPKVLAFIRQNLNDELGAG